MHPFMLWKTLMPIPFFCRAAVMDQDLIVPTHARPHQTVASFRLLTIQGLNCTNLCSLQQHLYTGIKKERKKKKRGAVNRSSSWSGSSSPLQAGREEQGQSHAGSAHQPGSACSIRPFISVTSSPILLQISIPNPLGLGPVGIPVKASKEYKNERKPHSGRLKQRKGSCVLCKGAGLIFLGERSGCSVLGQHRPGGHLAAAARFERRSYPTAGGDVRVLHVYAASTEHAYKPEHVCHHAVSHSHTEEGVQGRLCHARVTNREQVSTQIMRSCLKISSATLAPL